MAEGLDIMEWMDALPIGSTETISKTFSESDAYNYVGVVGDFNPVYVDQEQASHTAAGSRVVPWAMLGGCLGVVTAEITKPITPPGTVSVGYDLSFEIPVVHGSTITTTLTLEEKLEERATLVFRATFTNEKGECVGAGKVFSKVTKSA